MNPLLMWRGQVYSRSPVQKRDEWGQYHTWVSRCAECGKPFGAKIYDHKIKSMDSLQRRCEEHRRSSKDVEAVFLLSEDEGMSWKKLPRKVRLRDILGRGPK